jgi:5'-nucleotidase/UDP-sugar diphosphatase
LAVFTILHTNDLHNHFGPLDWLKDNPKGPDTLLLDAGDAILGSNTLFRFNEPILARMNEAGYDAMTLGNREFHYLRAVVKRRAMETGFPILASNLEDLSGVLADILTPYIIREIRGIRVALLGFSPVQFPEASLLARVTAFRFINPNEAAEKYVRKLAEEADVIVAVSHLGRCDDEKLARAVKGIHLIIGGHSHTLISNPLRVGDTYIVQAGCLGSHIGRLKVEAEPGHHPLKILEGGVIPC